MKNIWLKNLDVIITGASSGLGLKITEILIEKYGCRVIGTGRSVEKLEAVKQTFGEKFDYFAFDVADENGWKNFADYITENGIKANVLINNAGIMPRFCRAEKSSVKEQTKVFSTDFLSAVYSVEYVLPLLNAENKALINVSSSSALCSVAGESGYCAAKSALKAYTETLIAECDFYVALVMPGFADTDIFRSVSLNEKESKMIKKVAMAPEKCAKIIVKKLAKKKKRIITGVDAKFMNLLYRLFPATASKKLAKILKKFNMEIFKDVYEK